MKRLGREGAADGDSRAEIGYRVMDDKGVERLVLYHPAGKTKVAIQQVEIAPGMSAGRRSACARLIGGGA